MAFDAGMMCAVTSELQEKLAGSRVEKIYQPERDEIIIALHTKSGGAKLDICATPGSSRINITTVQKENPQNPPSFCTLLRKHLSGARLLEVSMPGFERVAKIIFEARDEMGFSQTRILFIEIMGKYSNMILTDGGLKISGVLRPVNFSLSVKRQLLPQMTYELPPAQDKLDPMSTSAEEFIALARDNPTLASDKFITAFYSGISSLVAREIASRSAEVAGQAPVSLYRAFEDVMNIIKTADFSPVIIYDGDRPVDFCFFDIRQYGGALSVRKMDSISEVIEEFYSQRDKAEHSRQRAHDLFRLVANAEGRLRKKISLQEQELGDCSQKESFRRVGELITSNMHTLKRGMSRATVTDYYDPDCGQVEISLDPRLSPSQNAQYYYKKYNKLKNAETELAKQIEAAKKELEYIITVKDCLERASGQSELDDIRSELAASGYVSPAAGKSPAKKEKEKTRPAEFFTRNGFRLLCGKNNIQNDYITFKAASKNDIWFHVKNVPGSHVVLFTQGREPTDDDIYDAACTAAIHSSLSGASKTAVDYTLVKNVKKPNGAKPGFVIYPTYKTVYVSPEKEGSRK